MAAKYQLITELYQRTSAGIARNAQAWQGFFSFCLPQFISAALTSRF